MWKNSQNFYKQILFLKRPVSFKLFKSFECNFFITSFDHIAETTNSYHWKHCLWIGKENQSFDSEETVTQITTSYQNNKIFPSLLTRFNDIASKDSSNAWSLNDCSKFLSFVSAGRLVKSQKRRLTCAEQWKNIRKWVLFSGNSLFLF